MNVLAVRQALTNGGAQAAERQLALLANSQGDEQLAILVRDLKPGEVSQLLAEGDYTKPSIVAHFVTPDQFVAALHRLGAKWGNLKNVDSQVLLPLKEQVADFMLSTLLHLEDEHQMKFLEAIIDDSVAEDVLTMIALFEAGCPEFLVEKEWATAQLGTWQELYMRVKELMPRTFENIRAEIISMYAGQHGELDDDDEHQGKPRNGSSSDKEMPGRAEKFMTRTLKALSKKASELVKLEPDKKEEEIFEDL